MFSVFFNPHPVRDYDSAVASDSAMYKRFFHGCLDRGVYLPPSAFETAFLSTAHAGSAIDRACEVLAASIKAL
jgi:glutamate-1-semialdehyde 2,1-aminomutase